MKTQQILCALLALAVLPAASAQPVSNDQAMSQALQQFIAAGIGKAFEKNPKARKLQTNELAVALIEALGTAIPKRSPGAAPSEAGLPAFTPDQQRQIEAAVAGAAGNSGGLQADQLKDLIPVLVEILGKGSNSPPKASGAGRAGRFSGRFANDELMLDSQANQDGYTGTLKLWERMFEFTARERSGELHGTFETPDGPFNFRATLQADTLTVATGTKRHELIRQNLNPLDQLGNSPSASQAGNNPLDPRPTTSDASVPASLPLNVPPKKKNWWDGVKARSKEAVGLQRPAATVGGTPSANAGDPRLVGRWQMMEYKAGSVVSVTKFYNADLRADGSAWFSESGETGYGGPLRGGSQSQNSLAGRWSTTGNQLTITLQSGGRDDYSYDVQPNGSGGTTLRLRPTAGGKPQEWSKVR